MFRVVRREDQREGDIADVVFEGEVYGSDVSLFLGELLPGKGPGLHRHPYSETCLVQAGQAAMTVDGEEVVASAGDILVIGPETPHAFTAVGDDPLRMVCIHASKRFVIDWLSGR
jgi:quercetin dioxygenase-like cupin family protein